MAATPLPAPEDTLLEPPDADEVRRLTDGVLDAIEPPGGRTEFQTILVTSAFEAMTGHPSSETPGRQPVTPEQFGSWLARRNQAFRQRILQTMMYGQENHTSNLLPCFSDSNLFTKPERKW